MAKQPQMMTPVQTSDDAAAYIELAEKARARRKVAPAVFTSETGLVELKEMQRIHAPQNRGRRGPKGEWIEKPVMHDMWIPNNPANLRKYAVQAYSPVRSAIDEQPVTCQNSILVECTQEQYEEGLARNAAQQAKWADDGNVTVQGDGAVVEVMGKPVKAGTSDYTRAMNDPEGALADMLDAGKNKP